MSGRRDRRVGREMEHYGILQRLIAQRLLARGRDSRDGRRAVLRLTARGARINAESAGTVEAAVATALAGCAPRDRAAARRVLERLSACLEGSTPRPPRAPRNGAFEPG